MNSYRKGLGEMLLNPHSIIMAHKKIKEFIERLNTRMFQSYQAYFIWKYLFLSRDIKTHGPILAEKHVKVINKYKNFYVQSERSNLVFFVIGIAKFFDNPKNSNKPLSIHKVQTCAQGDRRTLTVKEFLEENPNRPLVGKLAEAYEGITEKDLKEIDELIDKNKDIIEVFQTLRDKWAAHEDIEKKEIKIPAFEKVEALFIDIKKMINILSSGLDHSTTAYSHLEEITKRDIDQMFKDLI
jgi:hypothetical protein